MSTEDKARIMALQRIEQQIETVNQAVSILHSQQPTDAR